MPFHANLEIMKEIEDQKILQQNTKNNGDGTWENKDNFDELIFIGKKRLTRRELDVVACLLCGRSSTIPSFLSISQRTLEGHIRNITNKFECNSREGIIDYIETSDKLPKIKSHYKLLVINRLFEKYLNQISLSIKKDKISCTVVQSNCFEKTNLNLLGKIKDHLTLAGVITTEDLSNAEFSLTLIEKKYGLSNTKIEVNEDDTSPNKVSFLLNHRGNTKNNHTLTFKNYYDLMFDIIYKIYPQSNINVFINDFQKIIKSYKDLENPTSEQIESLSIEKNKKKSYFFHL